jgi:hypothetical protein
VRAMVRVVHRLVVDIARIGRLAVMDLGVGIRCRGTVLLMVIVRGSRCRTAMWIATLITACLVVHVDTLSTRYKNTL